MLRSYSLASEGHISSVSLLSICEKPLSVWEASQPLRTSAQTRCEPNLVSIFSAKSKRSLVFSSSHPRRVMDSKKIHRTVPLYRTLPWLAHRSFSMGEH